MSDKPVGAVVGDDPDDEVLVDLDDEIGVNPEEDGQPDDDEPDPPEGDDPDPEPATGARDAAPRRGSARVQGLVNENRELKARQAQFEQQLAALTNERRQPTQADQAAQRQQERERFELMSPYEQFEYTEARIGERVSRQTQQIAAGVWEQNDKTQFEATLRENPTFRRHVAKVDELRQMAPGVPRDILLDTAIGQYARANMAGARTRAGKALAAAAEQNGARPPAGRGNVPSDRGRGDGNAARDARLRAAGLIE